MKQISKLTTLMIALICCAALVLPSAVWAENVIKMHHLNKDDPFDNPTGAMATVPTARSKCRPFPTASLAKMLKWFSRSSPA